MAVDRPTRWAPAVAGALIAAEAVVLLMRPRGGVIAAAPVSTGEYFSRAELRRARRFGRPQLALRTAAGLTEGFVLAALARRPPRALQGPHEHPLAAGALGGAALSLALTAAPLPLSALMRKRALDAGLATQPWRGWASDVAKSSAIAAVLAGGGAALALGLMRRYGERWWVAGAAGSVAVGTAFTFAGPVVLDPIFNRFTPLPAGELRDDVLELAAAAGIRVKNVYEVDASRRTTAANAYVNGLGATKRVVLYDTLLRSFTREEARLVVAHELAHVHYRDVPHGLVGLALATPATMLAVARLTSRLDRSPQPGPATLPALALASGIVSSVAATVSLQLSRAIERRADSFSLTLTGAPEAFISFARRITLQNLADPDPPRLLAALLGSHPSTIERIGIAKAYAAGARQLSSESASNSGRFLMPSRAFQRE